MSQSKKGEILERGPREYWMVDGRPTHSRKKNTKGWRAVLTPPEAPSDSSNQHTMLLVRESQAEGEPKHWSIFVFKGEELGPGSVFQVTGDALMMTYAPGENVNAVYSDDFYDHFELGKITTEQRHKVEEIASNEAPPRAEAQRDVKENCQGWSIRVLQKAAEQGIISASKIPQVKSFLEPVRR